MDFLQRLDALIKDNNLTAKGITEQLNLGRTTVNDWKRGKSSPSPNTLIGLSQILGVSIDYLLTGTEDASKRVHLNMREIQTVQGNIIQVSGNSSIWGINVLFCDKKFMLSINCLENMQGIIDMYKRNPKTEVYDFYGAIHLKQHMGVDQLMVINEHISEIEMALESGSKAIEIQEDILGISVNIE